MTYIIAEAGSSGEGDLGRMATLVKVARKAGANAVKFQWTSSATRMADRRHAGEYREHYRRNLEWPRAWHEKLAAVCQEAGIDYMCSVYLPEDIEVVRWYVRHYKLSSFEACDKSMLDPYIKQLAGEFATSVHLDSPAGDPDSPRHMFVSTGMCDLGDVRKTGAAFAAYLPSYGANRAMGRVHLMHCTSAYPCSLESMNLQALDNDALDSYSDHSDPRLTWTGGAARLAGASAAIEAHFRLDSTSPENRDAAHSMDELQLSAYVQHIRDVERVMGRPTKEPDESEKAMMDHRVL